MRKPRNPFSSPMRARRTRSMERMRRNHEADHLRMFVAQRAIAAHRPGTAYRTLTSGRL